MAPTFIKCPAFSSPQVPSPPHKLPCSNRTPISKFSNYNIHGGLDDSIVLRLINRLAFTRRLHNLSCISPLISEFPESKPIWWARELLGTRTLHIRKFDIQYSMKKELPRKKRYLENTQHVNSVLDVVVVVARRALSPAVVLATWVSSPPQNPVRGREWR